MQNSGHTNRLKLRLLYRQKLDNVNNFDTLTILQPLAKSHLSERTDTLHLQPSQGSTAQRAPISKYSSETNTFATCFRSAREVGSNDGKNKITNA